MKRIFFSVLATLALMVPAAKADNVTPEQARQASANYMAYYTERPSLTTSDLTMVEQRMNDKLGVPSMYVYNINGGGWIALAGSTTMDPIVAYSETGVYPTDNKPEAMAWWLNGYNELICEVQNADAGDDFPDSRRWTDAITNNFKGSKGIVNLMANVKWGQGNNAGTTYNMYCPTINGVHCVTGCVATAIAQICYYYKYPRYSFGYVAYKYDGVNVLRVMYSDSAAFDYTIMPNQIKASTSQEARKEVSRLGYMVGVSVRMQYNTSAGGGSGAYTQDVPNAMVTNFHYQNGMSLINRGQGVTEANYMKWLRDELKANRPVYMHGSSLTGDGNDRAGHAWVCSGYQTDNENLYFMNWGWEGDGNSWYNLGANNMPISGRGYNFNQGQGYIRNFIPPQDSIDINISLAVPDGPEAVVLGTAYPNPASMSVMLPYSTQSAADLTVYNMMGQPVLTRSVQAGTGSVELRVDAMPAGIYIYRMGNAYGKFIVR